MLNSEPVTSILTEGILYSSFIGVIATILIGLYILIDVIRKFRLKVSKDFSPEYKAQYVMIMIYYTLIILAMLSLGSLRTNLFSRTRISSYTKTHCQMGVITHYCFVYPSFLLLHFIFIHRIQSILKESIHAHPSWLYYTLYALSIIVNSFGAVYSIMNVAYEKPGKIDWTVMYTPAKTFNFCSFDGTLSHQSWFRFPVVIICGVINVAINIVLLYMFNRGLYLLGTKDINGIKKGIQTQIERDYELAPVSGPRPALVPVQYSNSITEQMSPPISQPISPEKTGSKSPDLKEINEPIRKSPPMSKGPAALSIISSECSSPQSQSKENIFSPRMNTSSCDLQVIIDGESAPISKVHAGVLDTQMPQSVDEEYIEPRRRDTSSHSLQDIIEEYQANRNPKKEIDGTVKRLITMYNVMKKQTILSSIAIIWSTIFFIWTGFDAYAEVEIGWDFSINLICVWLMLRSSEKCWTWCKTKGLCQCCYLNTD